RQAIDRYLENPSEFFILDSEVDELKEAFNRGFTEGYMKGIRDNRLMSFERPNDRGLLIGRVTYIDVYTGKLGMQARREICQGDEIEIWVSRGGRVKVKVEELLVNGKRVQCAPAGSKVVAVVKEKRHRIKAGDRVFRVHNERMAKAAKELISGESAKKVPINIRAEIELGKPIKLEACVDKAVDDSSHTKERAEVTSDFLVEKGERKTLDVSGVIAQLSRLGNSVYQVRSWDILLEPGVMVPLGRLNELRRSLIERLDQARLKVHEKPKISVNEVRKRLLDELKAKEKSKCHRGKRQRIVLTVDVSNTNQAKEAIQNGADWIYLRRGFSRLGNFNLGELAKLCAGMGVKTALATGNIAHDSEIGDIIKLVEELADNIDAILVDNFGVYSAVESLGLPIFLDYHLNNFNRLSLKTFNGSTVSRVCLSPELSLEQISQIADSTEIEIETLIHGWLEVMTAEHCIPSILKGSCKICPKSKFYIEDAKRFRFPVEQDIKCRSHVYNSHELYLLPNISNLVKAGISSMRLLLNRYEPEIAGRITSVYREAIDLVAAGMDDVSIALNRAESLINDSKTTTGHYFKAVD
ncbi:MAG: DUF3656 domain-containing protein, partial [Actinomycetota bacterium]|nr:DUF3656 domain-containing protein [Actinomycetota bacterium]